MGKGGSGYEEGRRLQCRKTRRRMAAPRTRPRGAVVAGSGDAGQASPLGGG